MILSVMLLKMKKIFKSEIEPALLIPVVLVLAITDIIMVIMGVWPLVALLTLALLFIFYLYRNTTYEFTADLKLKVKSGFLFKREIYINSIRKLRTLKNMSASPALSRDRIEILYHRYGNIQVSPKDKIGFIEELKKINPRILVEKSVALK